jgi:hypothetical protein
LRGVRVGDGESRCACYRQMFEMNLAVDHLII